VLDTLSGSNYCSFVTATRREQAVQLRLAGLSRSRIAEALGLAPGGGEPLTTWPRDVPVPAWTKRPRAKDDIRETAVAMRKEGRSYREIREVVGVSKSTLSLWLRDVPSDRGATACAGLAVPLGRDSAGSSHPRQRRAARSVIQSEARAQIARLSESELFVAGVVAYWAEGAKNKPWRTGARVSFLNSDPAMILLFLQWLALIGVERDRLQFRLHIHESADVAAAEEFWAATVGVPAQIFDRTTLKRHNPVTVRKNVNECYRGCLCISVRRSTDLNLRIAGWFDGIAAGAGTLVGGSGVV
jgi:hypothetical protein